jgi:1-acyl-sn-glycerol-3-phosphate acyltransferase
LPRPIGFVAKAELAHTPIAGLLRRAGCQFVERFDAKRSVEDARRMATVLRSGIPLAYFPEGTFTRMPGLLPFHMGAFLTAAETGAAVVPVAIRGLRSILRGGSWWPRRGAARITVGEPLGANGPVAADLIWDRAIALRDAAREEILKHCGEPDLGLAHVQKDG